MANNQSKHRNIIRWGIGILFITIGILSLILVHPVPGLFYLLLSIIYIPPANDYIEKKSGFSLPIIVKKILALLIIWTKLAVRDLIEVFESKYFGT
jgi:hypothetical protein